MTEEPRSEPGHDTPEAPLSADDDQGHGEATLGPIDWAVWSYALIGVAAGLIVVAFFWVATG